MVYIVRFYCTLASTPAICVFPYNSILQWVAVDKEEATVSEVLVEEEEDEGDPRESGSVCQAACIAGTEEE